ncbi:hypothetical protein H0W26_00110 [Candidatus Dependentiae bacterium]|nr:hypothetical protein [Candidatus Dependentiae bacterium]
MEPPWTHADVLHGEMHAGELHGESGVGFTHGNGSHGGTTGAQHTGLGLQHRMRGQYTLFCRQTRVLQGRGQYTRLL